MPPRGRLRTAPIYHGRWPVKSSEKTSRAGIEAPHWLHSRDIDSSCSDSTAASCPKQLAQKLLSHLSHCCQVNTPKNPRFLPQPAQVAMRAPSAWTLTCEQKCPEQPGRPGWDQALSRTGGPARPPTSTRLFLDYSGPIEHRGAKGSKVKYPDSDLLRIWEH